MSASAPPSTPTPGRSVEPVEERINRRPPPWWLIGLVVVVLLLAVGGNFATGWRGRSDPPTTQPPPVDVSALVARNEVVVVAQAVTVTRIGEARDPAVDATVEVERYLKGTGPTRLEVYDKGFVLSWRQGERHVLFLQHRLGPPPWRVDARYLYKGAALEAPFTVADVTQAASRTH